MKREMLLTRNGEQRIMFACNPTKTNTPLRLGPLRGFIRTLGCTEPEISYRGDVMGRTPIVGLSVRKGSQRTSATGRFCRHCGKWFAARVDKVKQGKGIYCSRSCQSKWHATHIRQFDPVSQVSRVVLVHAHNQVCYAIRTGQLTRPSECEHCGKSCKPEGHHEDYNAPLAVEWLCQSCHSGRHWSYTERTEEVTS